MCLIYLCVYISISVSIYGTSQVTSKICISPSLWNSPRTVQPVSKGTQGHFLQHALQMSSEGNSLLSSYAVLSYQNLYVLSPSPEQNIPQPMFCIWPSPTLAASYMASAREIMRERSESKRREGLGLKNNVWSEYALWVTCEIFEENHKIIKRSQW